MTRPSGAKWMPTCSKSSSKPTSPARPRRTSDVSASRLKGVEPTRGTDWKTGVLDRWGRGCGDRRDRWRRVAGAVFADAGTEVADGDGSRRGAGTGADALRRAG